MKNLLLIFASALAPSLAWASSTQTVKMESLSFNPKTVEISQGDSVEWKNVSYTDHSASFDDSMDTGLVHPKAASKKIEFKTPGSFAYHCSIHGKSMSGLVVVRANDKK